MALLGKPLQQRQFILEINGVPFASCQEITPPEVEVEQSIYSDGDYDIKNGGRTKVGDLELSKVLDSLDDEDKWAWLWLKQVANYGDPTLVPSTFKRNGRIVLLDENKLPARTYVFEGAWVRKISLGTFSRTTSDNVIEKVTLSVDKFYEVLPL